MKGWIARITICLFLGVITTIAVAWGCSFAPEVYAFDADTGDGGFTARRAPCWFIRHYRRSGTHQVEAWPVTDLTAFFIISPDRLGRDDDGLKLPENLPTAVATGYLSDFIASQPPQNHVPIATSYGWPHPAFWRGVVLREGGRVSRFDDMATGEGFDRKYSEQMMSISWGFNPPYLESALLPDRRFGIVWSGLAVDIGVYTVAWMLLHLMLRTVRFAWLDWGTGRRVICAALCLLLGVVTTVGVAWGSAAWVEFDLAAVFFEQTKGGSWRGQDHQIWTILIDDDFARKRYTSTWSDPDLGIMHTGSFPPGPAEPLVPYWAPHLRPNYSPSTGRQHSRVVDASGWPLLALSSTRTGDAALQTTWLHLSVVDGIVLDSKALESHQRTYKAHILPLAPIWLGFAVDSAIYFVAWVSLSALAMLTFRGRSIYRRRSGRCIKCGYDLRGDFSAGCSECGWGR